MVAPVEIAAVAVTVPYCPLTPEELEAKMKEVRARFNVPDEMESPIKKGRGP